MAISQEFQKHLSSGNLAEAMKLALSEMIELRISTRVVSEDGSTDDRPGHQINTRINIVDGDIENEIGSVFLKDGPYSELRSFHAQQVADAQKIIRTNIESLQTLLGLLLQGLNRPSGQEPSADFQGTETGLGGMGAAMVTVAAGTAALGTMAMGASTAGVSTTGVTAEVSTVGDSTATTSTAASFTAGIGDGIGSGIGAEAQAQSFGAIGQFNAIEPIGLESIAPAALTPESEEPESFSALDGAGAWSEDEDLGVEGEPLSFLTETELGTQEPFATLTDEPLGALDLGLTASEGTIGELDLAVPERSEERSEDLDFVMDSDSLPTEEAFDLSLTEEPEPREFVEDGIATLQEQEPLGPLDVTLDEGLETPESEDDFALPSFDFEEPMAGFDIPEDLPDPLADLSFTSFGAVPPEPPAVEPQEPFDLMGEDSLSEDLMGEDSLGEDLMGEGDQDLEDPAIWNLAEEPEIGTEITSETGLDLEDEVLSSEFEINEVTESLEQEDAFAEDALAEASREDWNFEMTESSPTFSLEGTEDVLSEADLGADLIDDRFSPQELGEAELNPLESFAEVEDFPETIEPVGAEDLGMEDLGMEDLDMEDLGMDDLALESSSDSLEMESLEEMEDLEPFSDLADFDSPTNDRDLELGGLEDSVDSLTSVPEPQTFEEWEGIVPVGQAGGDLSMPEVQEVDSDEIDSDEWAIDESPALSASLDDLDDNWDDSDDMALSPEEMEASQTLRFDREEPLVGDAMGLADLDAMDSLFQNSDDHFDDPNSAALAELDPFLDLDDPFDDAPLFPPPPPRPSR